MNFMSRALLISTVAAIIGLASCSAVSKVGQNSAAFVQKTTSKVSQLSEVAANTIRPAGVKVVEVREKDLKPQPTGREQALAFQNTRKRSFWSFRGPVDFKEPSLPEPGGEMDSSLLPPIAP